MYDHGDDPVSGRERLPENVRLICAGDPVGCSGKANAIAAGMEAAKHDRLVWTDDDFHHPPDWLDQLHQDYAEYGPTTELPAFVGQDPLAVLLEPIYVLGGTLGTYVGDHAWAGLSSPTGGQSCHGCSDRRFVSSLVASVYSASVRRVVVTAQSRQSVHSRGL